MSKIEEFVKGLQDAIKEAEQRGFQSGIEFVAERYVVIRRDNFLEWASHLVEHIRSLEGMDESGGFAGSEEPPQDQAPEPKKTPGRPKKKKPELMDEKKVPTLTPEQERAFEQAVEKAAHTSTPDSVNW